MTGLGLNFVVKAALFAGNENFPKKSKDKDCRFCPSKNDAKRSFFSLFALQLITFGRNDIQYLPHWLSKVEETTRACNKTKVETWFNRLLKIEFFN